MTQNAMQAKKSRSFTVGVSFRLSSYYSLISIFNSYQQKNFKKEVDQRNILQMNRRCQSCAPEELKTLDLIYDNGSDDGGDTVRTSLTSSKDNQNKIGSIDEDTVSLVQTEESSLRRDSASIHGD
jgi:hypothetical protein